MLLTSCTKEEPTEITLRDGHDLVFINDDYTDPGCNVKYKGSNYFISLSEPVDTSIIGEQKLVYEKMIDGKTFQCKRTIVVITDQTPSVSLNPGVDTIKVGEIHIDSGINIIDYYGESTFTANSNVDKTTPGTYTILYTITYKTSEVTYQNTHIIRYVTVTD